MNLWWGLGLINHLPHFFFFTNLQNIACNGCCSAAGSAQQHHLPPAGQWRRAGALGVDANRRPPTSGACRLHPALVVPLHLWRRHRARKSPTRGCCGHVDECVERPWQMTAHLWKGITWLHKQTSHMATQTKKSHGHTNKQVTWPHKQTSDMAAVLL